MSRTYGDLVAVHELNVVVPAGDLVALVGPNGAGKTTLLAMAAGLIEPSRGGVDIAGHSAGSLPARAAASYIPDGPVLYDDLSLDEHLEYVARLHGARDWEDRGRRLLERFEMQDWGENLPSQFSRGMRQKASIALGFIRPFSVLLADEPFDGLDPPSRGVLIELLREARTEGAAVIVSTHRAEAADFADRFLALRDGELSYDGVADPAVIEGTAPPTPDSSID